ncbi:MAG: HprK-related kinase A [Gallionella sp.]|nr:HprK-related kinase A [Gallionella sp.]MDD4945582.1 HprK-related kinase A [Gallionella sp.]MDD5612393.1 HprK-related kinase A [Gallionella sp.]
MNVAALPLAELECRLNQNGLWLRTGPFVSRIQTTIRSVAADISLLYADYPLEDFGAEAHAFADFHIQIAQPTNLRRWFKPQAMFLFDGASPFKPLPLDQAFPLLEWGLNWCVSAHANDLLIIHAAVIEKNGFAAILPAPPGSGKSTLCAALVQRGWRLLTDELALVRLTDGRLIPLPRPVSLKNQSIDILRDYAPAAVFSRPVSDTLKGTVAHMQPPCNSVARAQEAASAAWVIFPKYQADATTRLEPVSQSRTFMRIADNSFNYSLLGTRGFDTLTKLVGSCLCYDFTYSNLDEAVALFNSLPTDNIPK